MPIYVYRCPQCGTTKEKLQKMSDPPIKCECQDVEMEKQITADWKFTFTNGKGTSGGNTMR